MNREDEKDRNVHPILKQMFAWQIIAAESLQAARRDAGYLPKSTRRFIEQKADGKFDCKGKILELGDLDTIYAKVFLAIFRTTNGCGFVSYRDLNRELQAGGVEKTQDEKEIVKRIRNAIPSIFRYTKIPKLNQLGKRLLEIKRGKGIEFNNPEIES